MSSPSVNTVRFRPLSALKSKIVKPGRRPRRVAAGIYKGIILDLDLQRETQISD
jgi:hypothetical protein